MILSFTPRAVARLRELMKKQSLLPLGLRVSLMTKGCSGLSWKLDFVNSENKFDEKLHISGITVYVDPKAVLFIMGTSIDYISTDLEEGFVFKNPNETGKCGCGESFTI